MKKITISLFTILFLQFWSCNTKTKPIESSNDSISVAGKLENAILADLDSNYVLEKISNLHTLAEIEDEFGKKNVKKDSTIDGPEGAEFKVSVLFPNSNEEVVLNWDDKLPYKKLHSVVINCDSAGYKGKWHTKLGLQPGIYLDKVVALNQKDFTISGFGWDYGGHIVSWEGGKLDNNKQTGRFADFGKNKISGSQQSSITGDTEFNVSLEAIKLLNPVLNQVTVFVK